MDKRREPRVPIDQCARLTVLDGSERAMDARLANVSESGARVLTPQSLPQGAPVKVEWGETLLLGEVRYCEWSNSHYAVGLDLEHALYDLPVLARLANELLGTPLDEPVALTRRGQPAEPVEN